MDRYHLTLSLGARPVQHGWWASEKTARQKFVRWVGEYSGMTGSRIVLVDEVEQRVLDVWPPAA